MGLFNFFVDACGTLPADSHHMKYLIGFDTAKSLLINLLPLVVYRINESCQCNISMCSIYHNYVYIYTY